MIRLGQDRPVNQFSNPFMNYLAKQSVELCLTGGLKPALIKPSGMNAAAARESVGSIGVGSGPVALRHFARPGAMPLSDPKG